MNAPSSSHAIPSTAPRAPSHTVLLALDDVSKVFSKPLDFAAKAANMLGAKYKAEQVHAVGQVSLTVRRGEVVGLVGESGCGKSTLGRMAAGLHSLPAGRRLWKEVDVSAINAAARQRAQLAIQMIFQDPYASINPRMRMQQIVGEAPVFHRIVDAAQQKTYVEDLLVRVGLDPSVIRRFPHQFSGGPRARIGIARALAVMPEFLICDESLAALDVSIQAQVLNLFIRLREKLNLTYLFISHDLGVVRHVSDRIVIMYLGRIVETADTDEIFARPNHPYTEALLAEVPTLDVVKCSYIPIAGEIPSPLDPPSGCHFNPRCPKALPRCSTDKPALREIAPGHLSAGHLNDIS